MPTPDFSSRRAHLSHLRWLASAILITALLSACGGGSSSPNSSTSTPPVLLSGKTSFVSADPSNFSSLGIVDEVYAANAMSTATATNVSRSVQEGDIYRVLDDGKTIVNLNQFRGLQLIDINNPSAPNIIGQLATRGVPVEMYRLGTKLYVLQNGNTEYRRVVKDGKESLEYYAGAQVVSVDISQASAPKIISTTRIPGTIQTSRMSTGDGKSALYIAANDYSTTNQSGQTKVYSFGVNAQGGLDAKSTLELGGFVQAIAATGERLMVARGPNSSQQQGSKVAVIDIASLDGVMQMGADVQVAGIVQKKNNLHIQGNSMRVVSTNAWLQANNTNHVETFDISNIKQPKAVDHDTFGDGQALFATTFLPDRAFFVTYLRRDPFHAFSISPTGVMQEENEFIVSGWNDFLTPVQNNTRLVGIGHNDENNKRALSVSLYDITNLKNTQPLLMRADMEIDNSWSEATWDDRAFSVLENATSALAPDGKTVETGLVLLPFSGWNNSSQEYRSGVQIFSFSATTITKRGVMEQASQVRRSFMPQQDNKLAANLSDSELSLFSLTNTNQPAKQSKLSLAPSYSQLLTFANVAARYKNDASMSFSDAKSKDVVELVSLNNINATTALASIEVPAYSTIYNVGGKLAVVSTSYLNGAIKTTIATWNISNPAQPLSMGKLETSEIAQNNFGVIFNSCGIVSCGNQYLAMESKVVGNALVFFGYEFQAQPQTDLTIPARYWSNLQLFVVDLSNPTTPVLLPKIKLENNHESVAIIANGSDLWLNYKRPEVSTNPKQAQAKYFAKRLDLRNSAAPVFGKEINIPGQLMAVVGNQLYSKDFHWNAKGNIEDSLEMLIVQDDLAYSQASLLLENQLVLNLIEDNGKVFASTAASIGFVPSSTTLYAVANKTFVAQASLKPEIWNNVRDARNGKVLLDVSGGILLYDFNQTTPSAQAFFPMGGWSSKATIVGQQIYLPAYSFGIYQFDFATVNLQ